MTGVQTCALPISVDVAHQGLKVEDLKPGQRVSIDQYVSSVPGVRSVNQPDAEYGLRYIGGTIFCDHATGYIVCAHQSSLSVHSTI